MRVVICGGGNMGESLARSLLASAKIFREQLWIVERSAARRRDLSDLLGCSVIAAVSQEIEASAVLILAVKPQDAEELLQDLALFLPKQPLIISIMAGVSVDRITALLKRNLPIVRAMPNLALQVSAAMTVLYAPEQVSQHQVSLAQEIFEAGGKVLRVAREELLDAATAIAGSGPGYVYYFQQQLEEAALQLGFTPQESAFLVRQTCLGALHYQGQAEISLEDLIKKVASKGGTTESALDYLISQGWSEVLREAVKRAYVRAREFSATF